MSQENVEAIREMYAAWGRGDIEWLIERSDPEIEIIQPPEVPDSKIYRGHAGVREAFDDWPKQWDEFRVELLDVIDVSDTQTISVSRHYLKARGIDMEQEVTYLHTSRMDWPLGSRCSSLGPKPSRPPGCRSSPLRTFNIGGRRSGSAASTSGERVRVPCRRRP